MSNDTRCVPVRVGDFGGLRVRGDHAQVLASMRAAIGDPAPRLMSILHARTLEAKRDLRWFVESWGWAGSWGAVAVITGIYGDWTYLDDDRLFIPALAPHVDDGTIICQDIDTGEHFAWLIENDEAARYAVEVEQEFYVGKALP